MQRKQTTFLGAIFLLSASAALAVDHIALSAWLTGGQVRDGEGDPDGRASVGLALDLANQSAAWALHVDNVDKPQSFQIRRCGNGETLGSNNVPIVDILLNLTNGSATGVEPLTVSTVSNLATWSELCAVITTRSSPLGAIRGELVAAPEPGRVVFPIVASAPGLEGTFFRTDIRLTTQTNPYETGAISVILDYYAANTSGLENPTATRTVTLSHNHELVLDDVLKNTFGLESAKGALVVRSPRRIQATARIYNDQRAVGKGTLGQFEVAMNTAQAKINHSGILPHLSYRPADSGSGFRTNVGWFNPGTQPVVVRFTALSAAGEEIVVSDPITIPAGAQEQRSLALLFPAISFPTTDDFVIRYEATTDAITLLAYASVVDNVNGDAVFVPAQLQ